eukprot:7230320-Prymnesium_polylepis.1
MLAERRRLQRFMRRLGQVNVGRAFSKWTEVLGERDVVSRHARGWIGFKQMKRLAEMWHKWKCAAHGRCAALPCKPAPHPPPTAAHPHPRARARLHRSLTEDRRHRSQMLATHSRVLKAYRAENDDD